MADIAIDVTAAELEESVKQRATDLNLESGVIKLLTPAGAIGEGVQLPPGGDEWKLLTDQTLEQDTVNVTVTKDPQGQSVKIKKLFLLFEGRCANDNALLRMMMLDTQTLMWQVFQGTTEPFVFWLYAEMIVPGTYRCVYPLSVLPDKALDQINYEQNTGENTLGGRIVSYGTAPGQYNSTATRFTFGATTTLYQLKAGSKIRAWYVPAEKEE